MVEDDPEVRNTLVELLAVEGYDTTARATAETALARLKAQRFDLVLSDLRLPGLDGTTFLSVAIEQGLIRAAQAILVTAHPSLAKPPEGVEVIEKPMKPELLLSRVAAALGQAAK